MSATWASALLGATILRRKEPAIEAFKRTAELADQEHKKAIVELECATKELIQIVEKKIS